MFSTDNQWPALCHLCQTAKPGRSEVLPVAGPAIGKTNPVGKIELS